MNPEPEQAKRRKLLDAILRYSLLGAIGLVAGRLLSRPASGPLHPDENCTGSGLCRGCRALADCRLPQAELFRKAPER
jgi:hypothetical protein